MHLGVDMFFISDEGEMSDLRPRYRVMYKAGCASGLVWTLCSKEKNVLLSRIDSPHQSSTAPAPFRTCGLCRKLARLFFFYFVNVATPTLSSSSCSKQNTLSRFVEFCNLHHGIGSNSASSDPFHFLRPCYLELISSYEIHGL